MARTSDERSGILRSYFEITEQDRTNPNDLVKRPTRAHKRIAKLAEQGFIKVILTTNFDTLLEQALDTLHASYQVISSAADIRNALPLVHSKCTVIKLNGDYKNANIRNTVEELSSYEQQLQSLLDQVLSEYGLVVCGWSAESDVALAATLQNCESTRYSTYWTVRKQPRASVEPLIKQRKAHMIDISDADSFFTQLEEKIDALKNMDRTPALSAHMASATVKRYLRSPEYRIDLNDFVMKQVEDSLRPLSFASLVLNLTNNLDELRRVVQHYEESTKIVRAIMVTGCHWGESAHQGIWMECLHRISAANLHLDGTQEAYLKVYPALLTLYSGGIAAIAAGKNDVESGKYQLLSRLLTKLNPKTRSTLRSQPLISVVRTDAVLPLPIGQRLTQVSHISAPGSEYLYRVLWPSFSDILPFEDEFRESFDRFEYFLNLVHAELTQGKSQAPGGLYREREELPRGEDIVSKIELEKTQYGDAWPPFKAGLFGGSLSGFNHIKSLLDASYSRA